jgi:hypothetical protein
MGSKWFTGGVMAAPRGRIQFDFRPDGVRYRPTIKRPPSEANLRRARERLEAIKHRIDDGTFSFADEFPDYRFLRRLRGVYKVRLCNDVFDEYLAHCEAREPCWLEEASESLKARNRTGRGRVPPQCVWPDRSPFNTMVLRR